MRMRILSALLILTASSFAEPQVDFKAPKNTGPGLYEIGDVKLDQNKRTVTFPAKVNMVDGLVEYYMVRPEGSVHESVLVSDVQPQEVHMAMTLLGAKGMVPDKDTAQKGPARIDADYLAKAPKITGDNISMTVTWKDPAGAEKTAPAETWMVRRVAVAKKPAKNIAAEEGPWLYNGSLFFENRFLAQTEGVFISVVTYPSALINNPRKGSNDDHQWFVNTASIPPKDTPVTFTIQLNQVGEAAKDQPADKADKPADEKEKPAPKNSPKDTKKQPAK